MERAIIRWTGFVALGMASASLGFSLALLSCDRGQSPLAQPEPSGSSAPEGPRAPVEPSASSTSPGPLAIQAAPKLPEATDRAGQDSSGGKKRSTEPSQGEATTESPRVQRVVVATRVKDREPVQPGRVFALSKEPLYAFVELSNRTERDQHVTVTFEKGDKKTGWVELGVPARAGRWRTWARTRGVREPGDWRVVVRAADGTEIASTEFQVQGAGEVDNG